MSMGRGRMPGPQDNNRRELRRPMGGDDELARGMGRMDPFGYNQYGGSGGRYGMPNQFEPPRPAPNADGWSSGEDFVGWNDQGHQFQQQPPQHHPNNHRTPAQSRLQYNQQQYQQRQQQQQQWGQPHMQHAPQWNIGASEFVPKSNLSVSAEEFVPRTMARNTSQWAYQQQQQQHQQQQQQQMSDYSANSYGYQPHMNYPGGSNYGNSNESNAQYDSSSGMPNYGRGGGGGGGSSHYDPSEVLSDAIATIVFMPSKFDRTTYHLAEKFNSSIGDRQSLSDLVTAIVEQCLKEDQFLNLAGRMCAYLAKNVSLNFEGVTLKSLLIQKFEDLVSQSSVLLQGNEKRVHCLVTILSDVYLQLTSAPNQSWKVHDSDVGDCLYKLLTVLFQTGTPSNVKIATQKLKLCGKTIEGEEKFCNVDDVSQSDEEKVWADNPAPKMDALVTLVEPLASKDTLPEETRSEIKMVLDTRKNNRWADAEAENAKAKEAQAQAMQSSAPKKSSAIRIEPDPNDDRTKAKPEKQPQPPANEGELTEEELKFMSEEIGEEEDSEQEELDGMTEDIADAYEQFLAEQSQNGGKGDS